MGFTTPTTRAAGYVVQATDWNNEIAYNGLWLGSNTVGANGGKPAVLAIETTDQVIATGAGAAITFNDTDVYDTQSQHDTTTNTSRITCGATANIGLYHFTASGVWATQATGVRTVALRLNGATELYKVSGTISTQWHWNLSGYYRFTAITDYMEVFATQNSGGNISMSNSVLSAKFGAVWISA